MVDNTCFKGATGGMGREIVIFWLYNFFWSRACANVVCFIFFRSSTEPRYKKALSRFIFSGDDVLPKVNGRAGIFLMIYKIHRRGGGWGRVGRVVGGFGCVAVKLT